MARPGHRGDEEVVSAGVGAGAHILELPAAGLVPAPVGEEARPGEEVHVAQRGHRAVLGNDGPVEPGMFNSFIVFKSLIFKRMIH